MFVILYERSPFALNIITGPVISYLAIFMNILIFFTLFAKNLVSPATVIMQGLSLADCLTAVCLYGFEPLFAYFYRYIGSNLIDLSYPFCAIHYCLQQLADKFLLTSVLLTTCLGLQKMVSVAFPIWCRLNMTTKKAVIVCYFCFLFSLAIHMPRVFAVSFATSRADNKCVMTESLKALEHYMFTYYPLLFMAVLSSAMLVMLVSTFYITIKLCMRKKVRGTISMSKYERKSSVLILSVLVVFVLSEAPRLYINGIISTTYWTTNDKRQFVFQRVQADMKRDSTICLDNMENNIGILKDVCFFGIDSNNDTYKDTSKDLENRFSHIQLREYVIRLLENILNFFYEKEHQIHVNDRLGLMTRYRHLLNVSSEPNLLYGKEKLYLENLVRSSFCMMMQPVELCDICPLLCTGINSSLDVYSALVLYTAYDITLSFERIFLLKAEQLLDMQYGYKVFANDLLYDLIDRRSGEQNIFYYDEICYNKVAAISMLQYSNCFAQLYTNLFQHLQLLLLASSPYTEQMNYMINTIMSYQNSHLKDLKLLAEILKLSTVIACVSNFIIYILMSSKLRHEMSQKFPYRVCK